MLMPSVYADVSFFVTRKCQKIWKKLMEIVNIEEENLPIFSMTQGVSVKFSGNTWLIILLKNLKKTGLLPLSGKYSFGKIMEGEAVRLVPSAFLELIGTLIGAGKVPLHWDFTSPVKKITHQNRLAQLVKGQGCWFKLWWILGWVWHGIN